MVTGPRVWVCRPCCLTGGVDLGGGRVLHMGGFLRGRQPLGSLGAVWFCTKAFLRSRRPLYFLGAVYLGMVGTVEKLQLPTSFYPNQARIKFSIGQCVTEVLCDIAPTNSCHLVLRWAWVYFKTLNLDERSLYLRLEGHEMKLKFMTPRQAKKDQHTLKEKIEKERIEKEEI